MTRALAIACLVWHTLVAAEPVRQAVSQGELGPNQPIPGFYNGYVYWIESMDSFLRLYAPDGHLEAGLSVGGKSPDPIFVAGVAVDSDGTIAVSRAFGRTGAGVSGIDLYDANMRPIRTIDIGSFIASQITFAPDHTVWGFGYEWTPGKPGVPASTDFMTVRQFSQDGKQLGAWLPRSTFPKGLQPASENWQQRRITVIQDRVGLLAVSGEVGTQQEWLEMSLDGKILGRYRLDNFPHPRAGLTTDGHVYLQNGMAARNMGLYTLDRATSAWNPVAAPMNGYFYGVDGDNLVFANWADGPLHLFWFSQTPS